VPNATRRRRCCCNSPCHCPQTCERWYCDILSFPLPCPVHPWRLRGTRRRCHSVSRSHLRVTVHKRRPVYLLVLLYRFVFYRHFFIDGGNPLTITHSVLAGLARALDGLACSDNVHKRRPVLPIVRPTILDELAHLLPRRRRPVQLRARSLSPSHHQRDLLRP
jgi:hypothetical protein